MIQLTLKYRRLQKVFCSHSLTQLFIYLRFVVLFNFLRWLLLFLHSVFSNIFYLNLSFRIFNFFLCLIFHLLYFLLIFRRCSAIFFLSFLLFWFIPYLFLSLCMCLPFCFNLLKAVCLQLHCLHYFIHYISTYHLCFIHITSLSFSFLKLFASLIFKLNFFCFYNNIFHWIFKFVIF